MDVGVDVDAGPGASRDGEAVRVVSREVRREEMVGVLAPEAGTGRGEAMLAIAELYRVASVSIAREADCCFSGGLDVNAGETNAQVCLEPDGVLSLAVEEFVLGTRENQALLRSSQVHRVE